MPLLARFRSSTALMAVVGLLQSQAAVAQTAPVDASMTVMPDSSRFVKQYASIPLLQQVLTPAQKHILLKQKIKYVFVLFQENRSFDHYFGTFPGVNGLFTRPAAATPGFMQQIVNTDGSVGTITPFLVPQTITAVNGATIPLYPSDLADVDHGHTGIDNGIDVDPATGTSRNDRFALDNEGYTTLNGTIVSKTTMLPLTTNPTLAQKQAGEVVMAHVDCDTVPFMWQYADRFAMMDNFHMTVDGPSTPNAIAMIAGQAGETQWALHPSQSASEPVTGDPGPFPGSNMDTSAIKPAYGQDENPASPTLNQTYATLPLSFMGPQIQNIIKADENPTLDLLDVQNDIQTIFKQNKTQVQWGWYQEGYDHEPFDPGTTAPHTSYIVHHNGPQYFGYLADNTQELLNLHGLNDFFTAMTAKALPNAGGVFYVRGGFNNTDSLKPVDPNPTVQASFAGNDDHPAYSDSQISEALLADEINAIAMSPYWSQSAIVITYDETSGYYDHAAFTPRSYAPDGGAYAGGQRIPAIVISPYAQAHIALHDYAEHSSVIKFINKLFGLTPLAELPDETNGRALGLQQFGQPQLGPADSDAVVKMSDLSEAFDNDRLLGRQPPLPPAYAIIPPTQVHTLPHYGGTGCSTLNITPTDYRNGQLIDPPPADFNPRPVATPGTPSSGTWTP